MLNFPVGGRARTIAAQFVRHPSLMFSGIGPPALGFLVMRTSFWTTHVYAQRACQDWHSPWARVTAVAAAVACA